MLFMACGKASVGLGGLVDSLSLLVRHLRDRSDMKLVEELDPTARLRTNGLNLPLIRLLERH